MSLLPRWRCRPRQWLQAVLPPGIRGRRVGLEQRLLTGQALSGCVEIALHNATDLGTLTAFGQVRQLGFAFDYTLVNQTAQEWARQYSYNLVTQITDVTRQQLQVAVGEWVEVARRCQRWCGGFRRTAHLGATGRC